MTGMREDLERKIHHQAPRPRLTHWSVAGALHPGVDPAACHECQVCPNPHCVGGRIDTTPANAIHPAAQTDTACPVCNGTGEGRLPNACACGDCFHPRFGPNTDGEPCQWCWDCACSINDHHAWTDRHGDVWRYGIDGLMYAPETAPFSREHVEKKWGPLRPTRVIRPGTGEAS